jgi:hypothetical protein
VRTMGAKRLASNLPPSWQPAASDNPESGRTSGLAPKDDLAYRVELWDHSRASVERVLAVTASVGIGFAAYYQAALEFPDRRISLRLQRRGHSDGFQFKRATTLFL